MCGARALSAGSGSADRLAGPGHLWHRGQGARPAERPAGRGGDQAAAARRICARPVHACLGAAGSVWERVCVLPGPVSSSPGPWARSTVRRGGGKFMGHNAAAGPELQAVREARDPEPEQPAAPAHCVTAGGASPNRHCSVWRSGFAKSLLYQGRRMRFMLSLCSPFAGPFQHEKGHPCNKAA